MRRGRVLGFVTAAVLDVVKQLLLQFLGDFEKW